MKKALGIDIGGTKISYALINSKGEILSDVKKTQTPKTKDEIFNTLKNIIKIFENEIDFTAIATAGAVNNENTRVIGSTANIAKGYSNIVFSELSSKKVFVENDANCAAWAEYKIGAAKNCPHNITLTLGTGVGGGIIIEGKLLKGSKGAAGEMHFMMSRKKERICTCGAHDCFEAYASGRGLRLTGIETTKNDAITTYDIIDGVKNGDNASIEALNIWQNDIALGILGLSNIFNPDCVVLSGSMAEFVDTEKIENKVNALVLTSKIKVYKAIAKNHAGMIGAVLLGYNT